MQHTPSSRSLARVVATVVLACSATAAHAAAPTLPVDQIVARNAAARGGVDAWRKVTTLTITGQMDANKPRSSRPDYHPPLEDPKRALASGKLTPKADPDANKVVELPYRLQMKRPRQTRLEIDVDGQTAVQIYDGTQGTKIRPFLGRATAEPYTEAELALAAEEQELDGPLIDHERKGTKIALEGVEKVDGADAYKLKLTLKSGAVRRVWVDATSFLDVKIDGSRKLDGKVHPLETHLRNYKSFGGLQFPTLSETVVQGVPGSTKLTVETVTVNPAIDDSRFKAEPTPKAPSGPPAAGKKP
jgi:hypothetical protein